MKKGSILYEETMTVLRAIENARRENRTDCSTNPRINATEYAVNELLTLCVLRLEKLEE